MQKDRKKEHKQVVKFMRALNKNLVSDSYLGLNRFRLDIYRENWYRFEDGSGGELFLMFKISDKWTNNFAIFTADNYSYKHKIAIYANDFMIRCSSGHAGHFPVLQYVVYDVHEIIPYARNNVVLNPDYFEDGVINKYNWLEG